MEQHECSKQHDDRRELVKLLTAALIGPLAWAVNLQVNYSLVRRACESGHATLLTLMSLVALVAVAGGFVASWRAWVRLRVEADPRGHRVVDRNLFLAVAGLSLNALFVLLILTAGSLHGLVSPCE